MGVFKLCFAAFVLAGLCVPLGAGAAETLDRTNGEPATLTVTGRAQLLRPPDVATVDATLRTNDDDATRALSQNNQRYGSLLAKLAPLAIGSKDIVSTSLQSNFNPRSAAQSNPPYGFVVTRSVRITVTALGQIGAVVDAAISAGATDLNGVSYGFADRPAVERAALAAAVADAYAQAQTIAAAAHLTIVRVLAIGDTPVPLRPAVMAMAMRRADAPVATTIDPSDLDVSSSITITYVIRGSDRN